MYSYEDRMRAVKLYTQYDHSIATVIRELGYPSRHMLVRWCQEYKESGNLHSRFKTPAWFSEEEKQVAIRHYTEHGMCISRTVRVLGYPSRQTMRKWIDDAFPGRNVHCVSQKSLVKCPKDKKEQAVIDFCARRSSAQKIADTYGVSRVSLYKWKKQLLNKERCIGMPKESVPLPSSEANLTSSIEELQAAKAALQEELYNLQLKYDILEKTTEILKKDKGISFSIISNREKAEVIDALRNKYRLNELLYFLNMAKSSYCYQARVIHNPDKYEQTRTRIQTIFDAVDGRYGYRRIHSVLQKDGITISEKVIRRLMKEENLVIHCSKRKKYSSYAGEISPGVENIVNRDFHAETPNTKWLTDITEFSIPAGKVYLSPIIDCFDGLAVSWSIGTSPDAELVNTMLDTAISYLGENESPIVHSDRGCHYRWPGWIERMSRAGLTRSMSKKGCSPDNSACEGFFGRLKNEMFYYRQWKDISVNEFIDIVDAYIHWYNEERIKVSLGGMSPLEYRRSLGLAG